MEVRWRVVICLNFFSSLLLFFCKVTPDRELWVSRWNLPLPMSQVKCRS